MQLRDKFETPLEADVFFANIEKMQNIYAMNTTAIGAGNHGGKALPPSSQDTAGKHCANLKQESIQRSAFHSMDTIAAPSETDPNYRTMMSTEK